MAGASTWSASSESRSTSPLRMAAIVPLGAARVSAGIPSTTNAICDSVPAGLSKRQIAVTAMCGRVGHSGMSATVLT
jgi:hypothetical protein